MRARKLRRLLERELGYAVVGSSGGSHRKMRAPNLPQITFAFHDGDEVGPAMVRTILVRNVGLTLEQAKEVARRA